MNVLFMNKPGNPFSAEPVPKSFYCPTNPLTLDKDEKRTACLSPARPLPCPLPPREQHWDLNTVPAKTKDGSTSFSSPSSSKFDESWPSTEGGSPGGGGGGEKSRDSSTLAKYIHRFRHAPPSTRTDRLAPNGSFWWQEQDHAHPPEVTPPKAPKDQSTPTSSGQRTSERGEGSGGEVTPPISLRLRVSSDGDDSLQGRSQNAIDKSSSMLTSSTLSSPPAQKYLNTRHQQQVDPVPSERKCVVPPLGLHRKLPLDPEGDILHQWRLRRRLELARKEAEAMVEEGKVYRGGNLGGVRPYRGFEMGRGGGRLVGENVGQSQRDETGICPHQRPDVQREIGAGLTRRCSQPSGPHHIPSSHQGSVMPPILHHPHLSTPSPHTLHPHTHLACDIIPCPCCGANSTAHVGPKKKSRAAAMASRNVLQGGMKEQTNGSDPHTCDLRTSSHRYVDQKPKVRSVTQLPAQQAEGKTEAPDSEPLFATPMSLVTPLGVQVEASTADVAASTQAERAAGRPQFPLSTVGSSLHLGSQLPASDVKGPKWEEGKEDRPPVKYPSPSLLSRLKSRRQKEVLPPAAEPRGQGGSEGESDEEESHSQLSLTFSSELDHSLTPLRPSGAHTHGLCMSRDEETDQEKEGGGAGDTDVSIGPIVSQAVERHLFGSPLHTPPPPSPTQLSTDPMTSKSLGASSPSVQPLPGLHWGAGMGDDLLNALIKKTKVFEAQLCEIDRLLAALGAD